VIRRAGAAKLLMTTTIALAGGGTSSAADWSETLDANSYLAYDRNPQLAAGSNVADRSAELAVDGNTTRATEVSQLTITPRISITRYERDSNLDITTGSLAVSFVDNGERGQLSLAGQALTDSTLTSELGQTGINSVNLRHDAYNATIGYLYSISERLSWLLQAGGQVTRYNSEAERYGLTSNNYDSLQLGPTWKFSDRLQGSLVLEADRIAPQSGQREKDYSASVQLKRAITEKYSWRVSVGATRVDIPGSLGPPTSEVFELGASSKTERIQWDLSARRAVLPIGLGLLAREDVATLTASIAVSERSTLNLTANVIHTDPVSIFIYLAPEFAFQYQIYRGAAWGQATAEWQYHFSPTWMLSAAYQQARARNYSLTEWANGKQARLGIIWQSSRL